MTTTTDARRIAAERMAEAAGAFLGALGEGQRTKAQLAFGAAERQLWYYTPNVRAGLPLLEMEPRQQLLAHKLVSSGLSRAGYVTAASILGLENVLHWNERWRTAPYPGTESGSRARDPLMYYATVYAEPGAATWGWAFSGHHISLNFTVKDGVLVSPTPTFFGADPADSAGVGPSVLRPLAGEEDLGRELVQLLDAEQQAKAVIAPIAPFDMVQSNRPRVEEGALPIPLAGLMGAFMPPAQREAMERMQTARDAALRPEDWEALRYHRAAPAGIAANELRADQRDALRALVRQYINRLPDEVADLEWEALAGSLDELRFAWAGPLEKGPNNGHYYRLHAPRFLVEYDNVQNGANHIHAVWRDPDNDFGMGSLAGHYAASHR